MSAYATAGVAPHAPAIVLALVGTTAAYATLSKSVTLSVDGKTKTVRTFGANVGDDQKNPDKYALYLSQSGLGLADREFYLRDNFKPQKERYQKYVADMLRLIGWEELEKNAADVVALDEALIRRLSAFVKKGGALLASDGGVIAVDASTGTQATVSPVGICIAPS